MLIELRKLKIIQELSEETPCYTAEIWIDGRLAFRASNRGHGGMDDYHQVGSITEAEVNAWLKANRPVPVFQGTELEPDLEHEVARLMDEAENIKMLRRQQRTRIITIEDGKVYTYPLKKRPAAHVIAAIKARKPAVEIINETGDEGLKRAVRILLDQATTADGEAG